MAVLNDMSKAKKLKMCKNWKCKFNVPSEAPQVSKSEDYFSHIDQCASLETLVLSIFSFSISWIF